MVLKQQLNLLEVVSNKKKSHTLGKTINIYIVYELSASISHTNDPTLKNSLFDAVKSSISIIIPVMELDLIEKEVFHFQVLGSVKM